MKRLISIAFLLLAISTITISQSCLPNGIAFSSQVEIDNFQNNYPNCSKIEGSITINGDSIFNLDGLNNITSIGGSLWLKRNPNLSSLSGLENIDSIGSYLRIRINKSLKNLSGLNNLSYIGGYLHISNNDSLMSLTGLESLTSLGGELEIIYNDTLTSLEGIDNISPSSISDLYIYNNNYLSDCNSQCICNYLVSPNGTVNIYSNAIGCNNPGEIASYCGFSLDCLPYGNYYFVSQNEVDNFETNYINCTELSGDLIVESYDITNLLGLNSITSLAGNLIIGRPYVPGYNPLLTSLEGLNNINVINGYLYITNNSALSSITGLDNLNSIGSGLQITHNNSLINLIGLNNLDSITGGIRIESNDNLNSLSGLDNLYLINGNLSIERNDDLIDLTGLNNLEFISGNLDIWGNDLLTDLSGLSNLAKIGEDLNIRSTQSLINFSGLDNLDSIEGSIDIEFNNSLIDFTGLESLNSMQGNLSIIYNNNLISLSGLDNINPNLINQLTIIENHDLSSCSVLSICDYLANPNGIINIYDNAVGCNNPPEIANECGFTLSCLPFGNYYLRSQADVDDFFVDYPDCFELKGGLNISGENITNLYGLNGLYSIEKGLGIYRNDSLINFTGLNTLDSIGGDFGVGYYEGNGNQMLHNFIGLEGLTTVNGLFRVMFNDALIDFTGLSSLVKTEGLAIWSNNSLINVSGLNNLDTINGELSIVSNPILDNISGFINLSYVSVSLNITNNDILSSLNGLDNIEPSTIEYLMIIDNTELASCAVSSICEYLADSNSFVIVQNNASGCNTPEEVEFACTLSIQSFDKVYNINLYPNPATTEINIFTDTDIGLREVNIYNLLGHKVLSKRWTNNRIDVSKLGQGIFIIELVTSTSKIREKIIIN